MCDGKRELAQETVNRAKRGDGAMGSLPSSPEFLPRFSLMFNVC